MKNEFTDGKRGLERLDHIINVLKKVISLAEKEVAEEEYLLQNNIPINDGCLKLELELKKHDLEEAKADLAYLEARRNDKAND